tara:strand:- start:2575 stop:2808 length:234 start_codon:yes stop_codon:yes gene_type:complete
MNTEYLLSTLKYYFKLDSILLTVVYTIGHMVIAVVCVMVITKASFELAMTDAFIEPIINGVWFFILHSFWKKFRHSS